MLGELKHHPGFASHYVAPRNVEVWLPPSYQETTSRSFPVVYMHDGQNLFDPKTSFLGVDWGIAEAIACLSAAKRGREAIVVGIWNTSKRVLEYMPQRPFEMSLEARMKARLRLGRWVFGRPLSDNYLKFILAEVKPFIDERYRTLSDREHTFIMGSSMGGLVSLYAVCEYPHVFAGAGCLSTHWPAVRGVIVDYLARVLPEAGNHKLYFDYGTRTLDARYEVYQEQVDRVMRTKGYQKGEDWITLKFEGAEHGERAWRERVHIPLEFLLGTEGHEGGQKRSVAPSAKF
jgi:predicted alpha/beta superfamily hydrolase